MKGKMEMPHMIFMKSVAPVWKILFEKVVTIL